jgi:oligogalacturonide lyase
MHIHSNGTDLIVGDGDRHDPVLLGWRIRRGTMEGPVRILRHGCSFKTQARHTHPRLSPDGRYLVFVSDKGNKGRLYRLPVTAIRF